MRETTAIVLCYLLILALVGTGTLEAAKATTYEMKYEGGSLNLDLHDKVKLTLGSDEITIRQGKATHAIPTSAITEISYGNDVHRRVGAAVGVGIVTLGVGAMLLLVKTKKHYVGAVWDNQTGNKGGVVFKVGKGEYRGFVAALEGLTGKRAVNADVTGEPAASKPAEAAAAQSAGPATPAPKKSESKVIAPKTEKQEAAPEREKTDDAAIGEVPVYIADSITTYHRQGCPYLPYGAKALPLKEARKGHTACKMCNPPE